MALACLASVATLLVGRLITQQSNTTHVLELQHHVGVGGHKLGRGASAGCRRICRRTQQDRCGSKLGAWLQPLPELQVRVVAAETACSMLRQPGTTTSAGMLRPPACMPAAASSFMDRSCSSRASFLSSPTTSCRMAGAGSRASESQAVEVAEARVPSHQLGSLHAGASQP